VDGRVVSSDVVRTHKEQVLLFPPQDGYYSQLTATFITTAGIHRTNHMQWLRMDRKKEAERGMSQAMLDQTPLDFFPWPVHVHSPQKLSNPLAQVSFLMHIQTYEK
jgi:hypothetical protein